ncbi:MAG: tetratricopeptide repeat protein, partial [Trichodesmium sp. MAG_R03]|nr:tetratricopeptide repeat protein [Trichodesmium sp. MAG_R03]
QPDFSAQVEDKLNEALHQQVKGKLEQALSYYRQAIENDPTNVESYEKALEIKPDDAELYLGLGNAFVAKGEVEKGVTAYQKAIEQNPQLFQYHQKLGEALVKVNRVNEAIAAFRRAIQLNSQAVLSLFNLGKELYKQEKFEDAVFFLERALEISPELIEAKNILNSVLNNKSKANEHLQFFEDSHHPIIESKVINGQIQNLWPEARTKEDQKETITSFPRTLELQEDLPKGNENNNHLLSKHRILLLDTNKETRNSYIILALTQALRQSENVDFLVVGNNKKALATFVDQKCDILIAVGGNGGEPSILSRLAALAEYSVLWTTEDPYEISENIRLSAMFDLVFSNDLACVPAYMGKAKHLPLAASKKYHNLPLREADDLYRYDLLFLGTAWPNRVKVINQLLCSLKRPLRPKIGLPYNQFLKTPQLVDKSIYYDWRTSNPNFTRFVNTSRIVLCLFREFAASSTNLSAGSTPPPRLFEVALAGGFQLAHSSGKEISRYFEPGKEIVMYDNKEDLVAKVEYYLDHPEERIQIAASAREKALLSHLYTHRIETILAEVESLKQKKRLKNRHISLQASQPKHILLVTHNVQTNRPGGGVEVYQEELKRMDGYLFSYLYPDDSSNYVVKRPDGQEVKYPVIELSSPNFLYENHREINFQRILVEHKIDLVHFQHLIGHPLSLPLIAKAMGVPTIYTFHDYYLLCKKFNLINYEGKFCDIARKSPENCEVCLSADGLPWGSQNRRRQFIYKVIGSLDKIITNTSYSRNYFLKLFYGIEPEKVEIVEMMMPFSNIQIIGNQKRININEKQVDKDNSYKLLKVVIPGNFTDVKGGHSMVRIFNSMRNDQIEFHIFGRVQSDLSEILNVLNIPNVTVHGNYKQNQIFKILQGFDVAIQIPIWPETYMISLSEVWYAGIVPIVTDIGAQGERVRHGETGLKVSVDDVGMVIEHLRRLNVDRPYLERLKENIKQIKIVKTTDHLEMLKPIYDKLVDKYPVPHRVNWVCEAQDFNLRLQDLGIRTNHPRWDVEDNLQDEQLSNSSLENSKDEFKDDLPGDLAQLPVKVAKSEEGFIFGMLELVSDWVIQAKNKEEIISAESHLELSGWAFDPQQNDSPTEVYFKIQRGEICQVASLEREKIGNKNQQLKNYKNATFCGFSGTLDLTKLIKGLYSVTLIQIYPSNAVYFELPWKLLVGVEDNDEVTKIKAQFNQKIYQELSEDLKDLPWRYVSDGIHLDRICDKYTSDFPNLKNVIHIPKGLSFEMSGWAIDFKNFEIPPKALICFQSINSEQKWFLDTTRYIRPDVVDFFSEQTFIYAGISAKSSLDNIPPGQYKFLIAQVSDREIIVTDSQIQVVVGTIDAYLNE